MIKGVCFAASFTVAGPLQLTGHVDESQLKSEKDELVDFEISSSVFFLRTLVSESQCACRASLASIVTPVLS